VEFTNEFVEKFVREETLNSKVVLDDEIPSGLEVKTEDTFFE
jgi:hypothetical protein